MKLKKQNVFDDFIAAAEWLIANKYTSTPRARDPGRLERRAAGRRGASTSGRSCSASRSRRSASWTCSASTSSRSAGTGSPTTARATTPDEFKALYAYSPLHNIKPGAKYPATLITTADHDDRVVPAHSFKYAATLQELAQHGQAAADSHRDEVRPRREQPDKTARDHGRHLLVHHAQHGGHADEDASELSVGSPGQSQYPWRPGKRNQGGHSRIHRGASRQPERSRLYGTRALTRSSRSSRAVLSGPSTFRPLHLLREPRGEGTSGPASW